MRHAAKEKFGWMPAREYVKNAERDRSGSNPNVRRGIPFQNQIPRIPIGDQVLAPPIEWSFRPHKSPEHTNVASRDEIHLGIVTQYLFRMLVVCNLSARHYNDHTEDLFYSFRKAL